MSNAGKRGFFLWHELMTGDTRGAADFYARVTGWAMQPSGMPDYTLLAADGIPAAGLMALSHVGADTPPHWLVYIGADDVDATAAAAERLGGRVLKAPTDIPGVGRFAVLSDPQGAAFAVYTFSGTTPAPDGGKVGGFSWHELATTDVEAALRFYGELFGWQRGIAHDMGSMGSYQIFDHGAAPGGGMYVLQGNAAPPHWLSYVRVRDVDQAVQAARAGGGRVLNGPMEVPGGSWIAVLMDPQGGSFAVHETPASMASGARRAEAAADMPGGAAPGQKRKAARKSAPKRTAPAAGRGGGRARKGTGRSAAKSSRGKKAAASSARGGRDRKGRPAATRSKAGGSRARGSGVRAKARRAPASRPPAKRPTARRKTAARTARRPARGRSARRRR